ncbi:MAG: radical SAM/SPASM domain-containing protein [Nanoarchaeota archaeon]
MDNPLRNIKNNLIKNNKINLFVKIVNAPLIGRIYDYIYFKKIKKNVKNSKIMLTVEPTNFCNLRCIMCPYKRMKRKKKIMSMNLFKKIINEASDMGCKDIHLTQYNEPFMDKHIFERIKYAKEKGMRVWFYSNAMLLDEKIRKKTLENPPDLIRFSVDGIKKETFENIRRGANYEKVVENITSLYKERNKINKKSPRIEVFFTSLKENEGESKEFLKFWEGKCDYASLYIADSRESEKYVTINYEKLKPYPCFNPKRILVLSNGKVVLCCVDIDGEVKLGDLKKQSLKEIIKSKDFQRVFKSQIERKCNIKMCKKCSKFYLDSTFSWWAEK